MLPLLAPNIVVVVVAGVTTSLGTPKVNGVLPGGLGPNVNPRPGAVSKHTINLLGQPVSMIFRPILNFTAQYAV
jgi:hypothetical protein